MLKQFPFIRLLIPLIIGIAIATQLQLKLNTAWLLTVVILLFVSCLFLLRTNTSFILQRLFGVTVFAFLFLSGVSITGNYSHYQPNYLTQIDSHPSTVVLEINEPLSEKPNTFKTVAKVKYISKGDSLVESNENVLVYIEKSDSAAILKYGDLIYAKIRMDTISLPKNPDEFNYKGYLNDHNIYRSAYLKESAWHNLHHNIGNIFLSTAYSLRNYCLVLFNKHIPNTNGERNIVSAIVLGYRDNLDADTKNSFADVGVIHIIAVAGLHVGLLLSLLLFLLKPLPNNRMSNGFRIAISLAVIWLFALVTGLPGSVLRASTMFSFIVIGRYSGKNYNTINLLAASAFFLLLCNPMLVKDVGFQLSFTAVAGILFLYPKLYNSIEVQNKLLDKIWSLTCLSISAQAALSPLTLFYFNQLPSYFILSNIIIIPLAALVLFFSVALIIMGKITFLASTLGIIISNLILAVESVIKWIGHLPLAVVTFSSFNFIEIVLLFAIILLAIFFLQKRIYEVLQSLLIISIIYFLFIAADKITLRRQQQVYHLQFQKKQLVEVLSSDSASLFTSEDLSTDKDLYNNYFKQHWRKRGIKQVHWIIEKPKN